MRSTVNEHCCTVDEHCCTVDEHCCTIANDYSQCYRDGRGAAGRHRI
jgi:hypothetical protein